VRTSLEFNVEGSTQKEIEEKVGQQIRKYLDLEDEQELGSYADVEIKVFSEVQEKYLAKVTVRIK
jgi:protein-disulfide isomerase